MPDNSLAKKKYSKAENRDMKEDRVTCGSNFERELKEVREFTLRTSVGKFSGGKNISCTYLTEKASSFEFLRNSDKTKWLESENKKAKNRKSAQRDNGCFITWDFAWISF